MAIDSFDSKLVRLEVSSTLQSTIFRIGIRFDSKLVRLEV